MEDIVQRVFAILMSVFMFFILPLYIAFEKKDDIAYALALKITNSFVDNVNSKGYLTLDMYDKYISELGTTGNIYDVSMEYNAKEYNPVIQVSGKDASGNLKIAATYDYLEKKDKYDEYIDGTNTDIITGLSISSDPKVEITYKLSEVKYTTSQILDLLGDTSNSYVSSTNYSGQSINFLPVTPRIYGLNDEGVLLMNEGDQFTVVVKNTNTTVATVLFNTLTFGANAGNDTKVYINYGGTVKNTEWMPQMMGDVNEDGKVDAKDQTLIQNYVSGTDKNLTLRQKIAADVNRDGVIDGIDENNITSLYN